MNQAAGRDEAYLDETVASFNAAVRKGDFREFVERFAEDAVLEFDGIPDPVLCGKAAIAQRYVDNPPDDQITIVRWKTQGQSIVAQFRWNDIPEASGGCFIIDRRGDLISHMTVAFGGPETRCFK